MKTDEAADLAMYLSQCLNGLGLLAAPKAWEACALRTDEASLRLGIIGAVQAVLEAMAAAESPLEVVGGLPLTPGDAPLAALLDEARQWNGGPPGPDLVALARECLAAFGVPEPEAGWEGFTVDDV